MTTWMERLRTWQFALLWGVVMFAALVLSGILLDRLENRHVDYSFLIPYVLLFTLATGTPATIRHRSSRLKRQSH